MGQLEEESGMSLPDSHARAGRDARRRAGKELRRRVPRESHAACPPPWGRDAVALLRAADRPRIPLLLPLRYQRMAASLFGFLRGAASIMARDLALVPAVGIPVQGCGDCHVKNFGAFTSPEGRILFDINDFDETLPDVDFTVDVKRLAASVAVLARDRNLPDRAARALAKVAARGYRRLMHELHLESPVEIWQRRMEVHHEVMSIYKGKVGDVLASILAETERKRADDANFPRYSVVNGIARIEDRADRIEHLDLGTGIDARTLLARYPASLLPERRRLLERYELHDTAFKVVGVGSVGVYCGVGLYLSPDGEALYLQIKEARPSVLAGTVAASTDGAHRGRAIVEGQRALQAATDIFLGWTDDESTGRHFYVRQLKQRRLDDIFDDLLDEIGTKQEQAAIESLAELCGRTLARAHARTTDAAFLSGYMGKSDAFDEALASFAMAYADNTHYDHARFSSAIDPSTGLPR